MSANEESYPWKSLIPDALPGKPLYEHPEDVRPGGDERIWEILNVILPNGDIGALGICGPWGEPLYESLLAAARERCVTEAGKNGTTGEGGTISVLTRDYRIEKR